MGDFHDTVGRGCVAEYMAVDIYSDATVGILRFRAQGQKYHLEFYTLGNRKPRRCRRSAVVWVAQLAAYNMLHEHIESSIS